MIDFPASPTDGQTFGAPNGVVYKYSAAYSSWLAQNPAPAIGGTGDFCALQTTSLPALPAALTALIPAPVITGNSGLWYNSTTGRYTPPAGRYKISASYTATLASAASNLALMLRKNGTILQQGSMTTGSGGFYGQPVVGLIVDANGSDYFDIQGQSVNGAATLAMIEFEASPLAGMQGPTGPTGQIGWRQIARVVPTAGQASIDFTSLPSDINDLQCTFDLAPTTNDDHFRMQFYDNTGALITGAVYNWTNALIQNTTALNGGSLASSSTSSGVLTSFFFNWVHPTAGNAIGNLALASVAGIRGDFTIPNIRDATRAKTVNWQCYYLNGTAGAYNGVRGHGIRAAAGMITGLHLYFGSGTIAAGGAITLWGSQ